MLVLLFADDVVLIARSREQLELLLKVFKDFCDEESLNINEAKTKIMTNNPGIQKGEHIAIAGLKLECV